MIKEHNFISCTFLSGARRFASAKAVKENENEVMRHDNNDPVVGLGQTHLLSVV